MTMTLERLLAAADDWWSTSEAASTASTMGGVGLIRWRHGPGVSPSMDVPFHTLRYRLGGYRSRRIGRGREQDFSGPRGSVAIVTEGPQGTWEYLDDVDCIEFYFGRDHIEHVAEREGVKRVEVRESDEVRDPLLVELTAELSSLALVGERESLYVETLVNAVLLRIARTHSDGGSVDAEPRHDLAPWIRRRVEEYLQANLANEVSLSEIAAEANLPPLGFAGAFRRSTGYSPFGYQRRLRMELAKTLLSRTSLSVSDIARQVGYNNTTTFVKIFTSEIGTKPDVWKSKT